MNFQREKNRDAFCRMFSEFLIIVFNDIMTEDNYIHSIQQWLATGNPYYGNKLNRHNESIFWLIHRAKDSLCFEVLGIQHIPKRKITNAILKRFHGSKKFNKFYTDFSRECK